MKISKDLLNNDVPATGQLKDGDCAAFMLKEGADLKLAFLGNSITRHGAAKELGWTGDWGMAASSAENDYVHRLVKLLEGGGRRVSYCVANLSEWERTREMSLLSTRYAQVKDFRADIVIVRLGENARLAENLQAFEPCYKDMVAYFSEGATVILTDLFWEYRPFDGFVERLAKDSGYNFVKIHDLGRGESMKAVGEFAHAGVAAHPGDRGMAEIAERIYRAIKKCGKRF